MCILNTIQTSMYMYVHVNVYGKKVCAEQTKQTVDSCFGLVGPHQHCVCVAAL